METTEKKPNGGYSRLKVKYAKLVAKKDELQSIVEQQATRLSQLSAELIVAKGNEQEWRRKYNEAIDHNGILASWWHRLLG